MQFETPRARYDARYVSNRMSRAIGHVKLVKSMVEQGTDCTGDPELLDDFKLELAKAIKK